MNLLRYMVIVILLVGYTAHGADNVAMYTLHIGLNTPPEGSGLSVLRYADDDAIKFYLFMKDFSSASVLSTVLDEQTSAGFSEADLAVVPPRQNDLSVSLKRLADMMRSDRDQGLRTIFYLTYSGHGEQVTDGTRLLLADGYIDKAWLEKNILGLPADVIHLFIDACHAEGLVDAKGKIKEESDATAVTVTEEVRTLFEGKSLLAAYPHVGALVASTTDAEAYEWSALGAGVFTHELLSALSGAADVNSDGRIVYSEVAAFVSAANRSVVHQKARPQIRSFPPAIDHDLPILSHSWTSALSFLKGVDDNLGRFHIETGDGRRILDAHFEPGT